MPEVRCAFCGQLFEVALHGSPCSEENASIKALLECECGGLSAFSVEENEPDGVQTHERLVDTFHPGVPESARQLAADAETAFWLGAYDGSLAASRSAIEAALREKGVMAGSFVEAVQEALDRKILDALHRAQIHLAGLENSQPQFVIQTGADRAHALAGLRAAAAVLTHLAEQGPSRGRRTPVAELIQFAPLQEAVL